MKRVCVHPGAAHCPPHMTITAALGTPMLFGM